MEKLKVSENPRIKSENSTRSIMFDVILALLPAATASMVIFGLQSLIVMAVCVATTVLSEFISGKLFKRKNTITDLSAIVTGLLLSFSLPVSIPLWQAAIGSAVAIIVVKQLFGGIGRNLVNPALVGRIVLATFFASSMSSWVKPLAYQTDNLDVVATATPLNLLDTGEKLPSLIDMFLGQTAGSLGETCALALLFGGLYLVIRRIITPIIPLCFVGTVAIITTIFGSNPLYEVLSGGLLLGAIFMATDKATAPATIKGQIVFGVGCGVITSLIRIFAFIPEGVAYAIVIMNILTVFIGAITRKQRKSQKRETRHSKSSKNIVLPTIALVLSLSVLATSFYFTNAFAKDSIEKQQEEKRNAAMKVALPSTDFKAMAEKDDCVMYAAYQGDHVGYVVSSSAKGYGGEIEVMVGIDLSGRIYNVEIVSCKGESAEIAQKVQSEEFKQSFCEKTKQEIEDIDVIAGATISSNAVKQAVTTAIEFYESQCDGNEVTDAEK